MAVPLLTRFARETRSDTAVEFALIGSVLFLFLFGIMFMGLAQFWQMTLDDAVRNAARQVEIRNVQSSAAFVTAVCGEFGAGVPNCAGSLKFDVQQAPLFSGITPVSVNTLSTSTSFPNLLKSAHAIVFQVAFQLPITLPLLPVGLMSGNGTPYLISAVAAIEQ